VHYRYLPRFGGTFHNVPIPLRQNAPGGAETLRFGAIHGTPDGKLKDLNCTARERIGWWFEARLRCRRERAGHGPRTASPGVLHKLRVLLKNSRFVQRAHFQPFPHKQHSSKFNDLRDRARLKVSYLGLENCFDRVFQQYPRLVQ
jgi:hypothetical protein